MAFRFPEKYRITSGPRRSHPRDGNNGSARISMLAPKGIVVLFVHASDGLGWEHVSVSVPGRDRCPTWAEMAYVKSLFWGDEDVVVQIHPRKSEYVNHHPYCLHLWRESGKDSPTPPWWMVGPKKENTADGR